MKKTEDQVEYWRIRALRGENLLESASTASKVAFLNSVGKQYEAERLEQMVEKPNAAVAAIKFFLENGLTEEFLSAWQGGDFKLIRMKWPTAPDAVFYSIEK